MWPALVRIKEDPTLSSEEVLAESSDSRRPGGGPYAGRALATGLTATAVVCAVALRWSDLGRQSLWYDEGFTAWASGLSPANIVRFARNDNAPPLYFLLQHYWGALFGNSEYALRGLSALFGTLSLPVFYLLAKKVLKDSMAVALAMWLFAFSLKQLWYSQEARTYEMASFFALVALYALVLFLEKRSWALFAAIVLSVTITLYLHNMMFFYLLGLNVTWLIYPAERAWAQRVKEILLADVLAGLLYLPWAFSLFNEVAAVHGNLWWVPRPTVWSLIRTLRDIAGFYLDYLAAAAGRLLPLSGHRVWVGGVGGVSLLCAALLVGGLWRVSRTDRIRNLSLLSYCVLPILAVFVLSQKILPVYIDRVFTASSVVVPLIFAYPLATQKERRARILYSFLGVVLGAATALSGFGYLRYQEKEDWRGAISNLLAIPEKNRLIVFVPPAAEILFDYYARRFRSPGPDITRVALPASYHEQFPFPKGRIIGVAEMSRLKLALESTKYSEVDLVVAHNVDPHGLLLDYLDRVFVRQGEKKFDGVTTVRFLAPH